MRRAGVRGPLRHLRGRGSDATRQRDQRSCGDPRTNPRWRCEPRRFGWVNGVSDELNHAHAQSQRAAEETTDDELRFAVRSSPRQIQGRSTRSHRDTRRGRRGLATVGWPSPITLTRPSSGQFRLSRRRDTTQRVARAGDPGASLAHPDASGRIQRHVGQVESGSLHWASSDRVQAPFGSCGWPAMLRRREHNQVDLDVQDGDQLAQLAARRASRGPVA